MKSNPPVLDVEQLKERFANLDQQWRETAAVLEDLGLQIAQATAQFAVGDRVRISHKLSKMDDGTFEITQLHHVGMSMVMQYKGRRVIDGRVGSTTYALWQIHTKEFDVQKVER